MRIYANIHVYVYNKEDMYRRKPRNMPQQILINSPHFLKIYIYRNNS